MQDGLAVAALAELRAGGRVAEATLVDGARHAQHGRPGQAIDALERLLDSEAGFVGWTIPVEPLLTPIQGVTAYARVLTRLTEGAA